MNDDDLITINATDILVDNSDMDMYVTVPNNYMDTHFSFTDEPEYQDISIAGRSLKGIIEGLEERLLILEPDFKKHEQYPALKDAYEKYKMIEKLISEGSKTS